MATATSTAPSILKAKRRLTADLLGSRKRLHIYSDVGRDSHRSMIGESIPSTYWQGRYRATDSMDRGPLFDLRRF